MENKDNQRVALVTGAANGIGMAIAQKYTTEGYAVAWVDRNVAPIHNYLTFQSEAKARYLVLEGDLADMAFLQYVVQACMDRWGRIDVLVNNAAWRTSDTLTHTSLEDWNRTLAVNVTAPAFLSKFTALALISLQQHCVFINMSSIMADNVAGYASAYAVCKGAIESLTYELATLYGPHGFRALAIRPGSVDTTLSNDYVDPQGANISTDIRAEIEGRTPLGRSASSEEIANAVFWLTTPDAGFITGTTLTIDGGLVHNFNSYALKKRLKANEF